MNLRNWKRTLALLLVLGALIAATGGAVHWSFVSFDTTTATDQ